MKVVAKGVQLFQTLEDEATSCNVVHPGQVHAREAVELVKDGLLSLVSLGKDDALSSSALDEIRFERIQHSTMRGSPLVNDVQVVWRRGAGSHTLSSSIDSTLGAAGEREGGFWRFDCCGHEEVWGLRRLTFELTGPRRQDALARAEKMYRVPQLGPRWPAVAGPVERGVRHRSRHCACA